MEFPRASGILLHPTSLPGRFGIGDLGDEAFKFVDLLVKTGQTYWQVLPLVQTGYGDSPYSSVSAFAGNTLLISPEKLAADGLLGGDSLANAPAFNNERVDYGKVYEWKSAILGEAFENFKAAPDPSLAGPLEQFCRENSWWLDDYAAYRTLRASLGQRPWYEWAEPLKLRNADALMRAGSQLARESEAEKFFQFLFFRQWLDLKGHANASGIKVIGDIPIFVALDSADVWCNQALFKLNDNGSPKVVSGVPPDFFSSTGQLWGNPIYDWDAMRGDNFGWWTARIAWAIKTADIVRLDHFIGFMRNWEVPGGDETAVNGQWADVPGHEFFSVLRERLGDLPVIAEDLGAMTPEIERLRDTFDFPGMRILHNAFGGDAKNRDLPHNYVQNCVSYTGTHDNDTTAGWYRSAPKNVRNHCRTYLASNGREIHWDMLRASWASVADTAIVPAQDLLGLGRNSRMNTPATTDGNWAWRLKDGDISDAIIEKLTGLTQTFGRANEFAKNGPEMP